MSDVSEKKAPPIRRQRSIYQVHYCLQKQREEMAKPFGEPKDIQVSAYDRQVAGHKTTRDTKYLGNSITDDLLGDLNDEALKELVPSVGHRIKIKNEIRKWKTETSSEPLHCVDELSHEEEQDVAAFFSTETAEALLFAEASTSEKASDLDATKVDTKKADLMQDFCHLHPGKENNLFSSLSLYKEKIVAYAKTKLQHIRDSDIKKSLSEYITLADGLLQCNNGTILKPILKPSHYREVEFYKRLSTTEDLDLQELRKFTPKYYGTRNFTYNGYEQEYIILEDLTEGMVEPCIMDLKIGKRTWDPLADEEKIAKEKTKYALCKQQYGFCIPGYQVYKLSSGKLHKFNKEYGKKLHGQLVIENIRNFLNGTETGVCRVLILQLLTQVWRIHEWTKRARPLRLHAASLLLVYDATELRRCCPPPADALDRLHQNHSFNHNYDDNLSKIRIDYRAALDRLSRDAGQTPSWARVTLIDFVHAFFNDEVETPTIDDNIKEGLDNFVAILETLLRETVDQIKW